MDSLAYLDSLSPQESLEISSLLSREPKGEITNPFPVNPLDPQAQSLYLTQSKGLNALDLEKFQLLLPSESDNVKDWENTFNNAKALVEYSNNRILELELLLKYGTSAWKTKILFLSQLLTLKEEELLDKKRKIDDINRLRKEGQLYISGSLNSWEKKYKNLLKSHQQVSAALANFQK